MKGEEERGRGELTLPAFGDKMLNYTSFLFFWLIFSQNWPLSLYSVQS